jgi:hypothetical protein
VIGLVLLATVLVSVLLALGRQRRLVQLADDRNFAIAQADQLLSAWLDTPAGVPLAAMSPIPSRPGWLWRTQVVKVQEIVGQAFPVVRLEIVDRSHASREEVLLASVETLHAPIGLP